MDKLDPIEQAIAEGARRALTKRAVALRHEARAMVTAETDQQGRLVPIVPPEARVKANTADMLDEAAAAITATQD